MTLEESTLIANILDDCARLLELAEGEREHAYYAGYVGGRLGAAATALRAGHAQDLEAIATALDREVARVQTERAGQGRRPGE